MPEESEGEGTSFLSKLDQFWVKRPADKPPVMKNEGLIAVSHEHWIKYVFPTFLYVVLMAGGLLLLYVAAFRVFPVEGVSYFFFILAVALLFITHHWFFWFLLGETQAHIIVTSRRVVHIHESLLWREEMVEVSFEKVKIVEVYKRNILQSVLNYGTLEFEGKGRMTRVPHPGTLARKIEQAMGMM